MGKVDVDANQRQALANAHVINDFFRILSHWDRDVADHWKAATAENTTPDKPWIISQRQLLTKVLEPFAVAQKAITMRQAEALIVIYTYLVGDDGKALLEKMFINLAGKGALELEPATEQERINAVNAIKGSNVASINFDNPHMSFEYRPSLYEKIGHLINAGEIKIYKALLPAGAYWYGNYSFDTNSLWINKEQSYSYHSKVAIMGHELTHAIQDWSDKNLAPLEREADAFIAGAIVALTIGIFDAHSADWNADMKVAIKSAAEAVRNGAGHSGEMYKEKSWLEYYDEVINSLMLAGNYVSQQEFYRESLETDPNTNLSVEPGEGDIEKKIFDSAADATVIKKIREAAAKAKQSEK